MVNTVMDFVNRRSVEFAPRNLTVKEKIVDALQVFVRGFETTNLGDKLVAKLEDIGFRIVLKAAGDADSMGGIIETNIVSIIELDPDDVQAIRKALHEVVGNS